MVNLLTTICIVATCAMMVVAAPSQAPLGSPVSAPAAAGADCSSLVYDLLDCMEFLVAGGSETTPDSSCCLGFKSLMEANEDCMCYALGTAASLGLDVNMTRAEALPADCRVSSPPISSCHVSTSPSGSPANSPITSAPIFPPAAAPARGGAPSLPPSAASPAPGDAPTVPPVNAPAATPAVGGAPTAGPVSASISAPTPVVSPQAGPTKGPISVPLISAPTPAVSPMAGPTKVVSGPSSEVAAPLPQKFPKKSGACIISVPFSAFHLVFLIFLF